MGADHMAPGTMLFGNGPAFFGAAGGAGGRGEKKQADNGRDQGNQQGFPAGG